MRSHLCLVMGFLGLSLSGVAAGADDFTLKQALDYPFPSELVAAPKGSAVAWVQDLGGARNIWLAESPTTAPRQLTHYSGDEGIEISHLHLSADGQYLVYVRGGDHDANWPEALEPAPDSMPDQPAMEVWSVNLKGGEPQLLGDGDSPEISPDSSRVAFIHLPERAIWSAPTAGGKGALLFFDRGKASDLTWSPDGKALAFVSGRGDHGFIAIYRDAKTPIQYLAPSTSNDFAPRWSPDGSRIAFVRVAGDAGAPKPILKQVPDPWSIWVADVATGKGAQAWASPKTLRGSYPQTEGESNLHWLSGDRLLFLADMDNWPHLYSVPAKGGEAKLLTPGKFMVEYVSVSTDGSRVAYSANIGATVGDQDRRHLYLMSADGSAPEKILTAGDRIEWKPVLTGDGKTLGFIQAGVQTPPLVVAGGVDKTDWHTLNADSIPKDFPSSGFITPKSVSFDAADGTEVHGQLYAADGGGRKPAIIFVHGGPPRQMLLGWHYMNYYANAYAVDQYLAAHGFVVLALNYRLGIGYGHDFNNPPKWGPTGAAEYQDVLAAAKFLMRDEHVDGKRLGIWGGSYGGYLTAMALSHNSDVFKAGVDLNGVHDWSYDLSDWFNGGKPRYEEGDRKEAMKVAWKSSPVAAMKGWRSPVLLIQGDDDRNVYFHEMIDLVNRLDDQGVQHEDLVIPNEIHGFLRRTSWIMADQATVAFFQKQLHP